MEELNKIDSGYRLRVAGCRLQIAGFYFTSENLNKLRLPTETATENYVTTSNKLSIL